VHVETEVAAQAHRRGSAANRRGPVRADASAASAAAAAAAVAAPPAAAATPASHGDGALVGAVRPICRRLLHHRLGAERRKEVVAGDVISPRVFVVVVVVVVVRVLWQRRHGERPRVAAFPPAPAR